MQSPGRLDTQAGKTDLADRSIQIGVTEDLDRGEEVLANTAEDKGTKDRSLGNKWRKKFLQSRL